MVNSMDKIILIATILCCVISLATCQDATETNNNSSDLSEGLCACVLYSSISLIFKVPIEAINLQITTANHYKSIITTAK